MAILKAKHNIKDKRCEKSLDILKGTIAMKLLQMCSIDNQMIEKHILRYVVCF